MWPRDFREGKVCKRCVNWERTRHRVPWSAPSPTYERMRTSHGFVIELHSNFDREAPVGTRAGASAPQTQFEIPWRVLAFNGHRSHRDKAPTRRGCYSPASCPCRVVLLTLGHGA